MAVVLPIVHTHNSFNNPLEITDQHFGMGLNLNDLLSSINCDEVKEVANPKNTSGSKVANNDKFKVNLDVQEFKADEIVVKIADKNTIIVEAKHEEKQDESGYVSRQFTRRYVVPDGHDISKVISSLSSDGVLTISVPRKGETGSEERTIRIQQTGVTTKSTENVKQSEGSPKKDKIFMF